MQSRLEARQGVPPQMDWSMPGLDPVFLVGEGHGLRLPPEYPLARMEAHMAHCLLRDPLDLTTHARRVLFWLAQPGTEGLAGAMADLALVLEGRGGALWQRLLARARPHLPADLLAALDEPGSAFPADIPHSLFAGTPAILRGHGD